MYDEGQLQCLTRTLHTILYRYVKENKHRLQVNPYHYELHAVFNLNNKLLLPVIMEQTNQMMFIFNIKVTAIFQLSFDLY